MRRSPFGQAITLEEYRELEPTLTRPLTNAPMRARHAMTDARHSRLVQPIPRRRTPQPAEETTAA